MSPELYITGMKSGRNVCFYSFKQGLQFLKLLYILFLILFCVCVGGVLYICTTACMWATLLSLFSPSIFIVFWESNSSLQACFTGQQTFLPAEPSCQTYCSLFKNYVFEIVTDMTDDTKHLFIKTILSVTHLPSVIEYLHQ